MSTAQTADDRRSGGGCRRFAYLLRYRDVSNGWPAIWLRSRGDRVPDVAELAVQRVLDVDHGGRDTERDHCREQRVLDQILTFGVPHELLQQRLHLALLLARCGPSAREADLAIF